MPRNTPSPLVKHGTLFARLRRILTLQLGRQNPASASRGSLRRSKHEPDFGPMPFVTGLESPPALKLEVGGKTFKWAKYGERLLSEDEALDNSK